MFIHTCILTYNRTYPYIPTGIIQMIFGICLRGVNSWNFRQMVDFFTEFMPMIIFAVGFFGYMVILIFVKWSINWDHRMAIGSCSYDQQGIIIIILIIIIIIIIIIIFIIIILFIIVIFIIIEHQISLSS